MATNSDMLQKLRDRLSKRKGFTRDPMEWRPPQVGPKEEFKAKAYILPPVERGEACASGKAEVGMDGLFFTQVGDHWVNKKRHPCPRVYDNDDCPYCQLGFSLLSETESKTSRSEISRSYLPRTQFVVNIYFPNIKTNPEELRGKVLYYAMPKTIFDKLEECIQQDNAGDDPDDPQPWGIFYNPHDAYPLSIVINRKGEYNSYVDSRFLAGGKGPIASTPEKIQAILDQRHDIPTKFPERTSENLQQLQKYVDDLLSPQDSSVSSESSSGFDSDETVVTETTTMSDPEPTSTRTETSSSSGSPVDDDDEELDALISSLKNS